MILEEITIKESKYSRMRAIRKNLGKEVILNDFHNLWCHGFLLKDGYNNDFYQMEMANAKGKTRLHYHDLKNLLIVQPSGYNEKYTRKLKEDFLIKKPS